MARRLNFSDLHEDLVRSLDSAYWRAAPHKRDAGFEIHARYNIPPLRDLDMNVVL